MLTGITSHIADIVIIAVIALVVFFVVRGMIRDKKAGKSSCGGSCAGCGACAGCAGCHACPGCNTRTAEQQINTQNT